MSPSQLVVGMRMSCWLESDSRGRKRVDFDLPDDRALRRAFGALGLVLFTAGPQTLSQPNYAILGSAGCAISQ